MERTRTLPPELTDRQQEVLRLIARGHTNTEIADMLGISLGGAKWHVSELLGQFNVETREELGEAWECEHGIRAGLRRWLGVAGAFVPVKAAAVASVAAVVAASGAAVIVIAGDDDRSADLPAATAAPVSPQDGTPAAIAPAHTSTGWSLQEALAEAARFLLGHGLEDITFDGDPTAVLVLVESELLEDIVEYQTSEPDWYWLSDGGTPRDVWYFRWRAEGLSGAYRNGERFEGATMDTQLWLEDGVQAREPLANRALLTNAAGHSGGGGGGLRSRMGDEIARGFDVPLGQTARVAWRNEEEGGGWLGAQRTKSGWCVWRFDSSGNRLGGGCSGQVGAALGMAVGSEVSLSPDGSIADLDVVVDAPPHVTTIEVRFSDGAVRRHTTTGDPAVPGRFVYLGLGAVAAPVTLVAYDAEGDEVDRHVVGHPPGFSQPAP